MHCSLSTTFAYPVLQLWEQLVLHLPPKAVLRLNINDSFMRRFSLEEALASLRQLHAAKPNVTLDFNTGHHYFGFRDTSPEVLSFFAAADYIKGLSFSLGLHGRATQVRNTHACTHAYDSMQDGMQRPSDRFYECPVKGECLKQLLDFTMKIHAYDAPSASTLYIHVCMNACTCPL